MSILDKLFSKKTTNQSGSLIPANSTIAAQNKILAIHPDLQNLLWVSDGPKKNYIPQNNDQVFEYNGIRITFSSFSSQEPSLISTRLPVQENVNPQQIERPPYFPTYAGLTAAQRGVYWKLLADPYGGQFDIGYVFVLYYGLERHLLEGRFEDAFHVILKLRDVYDNASFQSYSACALILTCLFRQRADLAEEFYQSLDKSHELNFSDNLYLLCKMGLNLPLTAPDIMRMAKTFEFTNQNYIKKHPELFYKGLIDAMQSGFGTDRLEISKFITRAEWRKLHKQAVPIFANVSIRDKSIDVPLISECFKLKKAAYDLLEQAHEGVKKELSQMRKEGTLPAEKKSKPAKVIEPLSFDSAQEKELLRQYKSARANAMDRHFALIALQDFYYKYRELDSRDLQMCIDYCNEDITLLPQVQSQYVREERANLQKLASVYSKKELTERLSAIHAFNGSIPAFKRLAIINEKSKNYARAIGTCNQAIEYYASVDMHDAVAEFEQRKQKLEAKAAATHDFS